MGNDMSRFSAYLAQQQPIYFTKQSWGARNKSTLFVTIPCFDEPDLPKSLASLADCIPPVSGVTVVVVINSSDKASREALDQNRRTLEAVEAWWSGLSAKPFYHLVVLHAPALPSKWAGVGWARKIAMDEAIRHLDQDEVVEGVLISFDADSTVSANYLISIESAFRKNPKYNFVTLNFAHPVDDQTLAPSLREGIILYELYLRYLRNALEWCGYPHAIHTVGSSFAVKASAYVKQGGMNRRQAGEDFHFLHKIVLLGEYGQIDDATVFPAARVSHRVPFGTGAALNKWEEGDKELNTVYSLKIFEDLSPLFADAGFFYKAERSEWDARIRQYDHRLHDYLLQSGIPDRLQELKSNCGDARTFAKRYYHQINAFRVIQYLNLCEMHPDGKGNLIVEASRLLEKLGIEVPMEASARELLEAYREIDKKSA